MQALSTTPTTQSQEISTASTNSNSTTDLNAGALPQGTCLSTCTNNNLITNGNVGCSILNNINAASFTDSPSSSSDLISTTNGQLSQATTPCTAAVSQQSPGSASSASPSSSCSSSSCTSNSASSPSSGLSVSVSSPPLQHSVLNGNGNQMEAVTTVNGSVVMHHPNQHQQQQQQHVAGVHHNSLLGNTHLSMSVPRQSHHHSHHQHNPQANGNTILSMAANLIAADLTSAPPPVMEQSHVLVDPNGSLIHPALRGVKTVNIGE